MITAQSGTKTGMN